LLRSQTPGRNARTLSSRQSGTALRARTLDAVRRQSAGQRWGPGATFPTGQATERRRRPTSRLRTRARARASSGSTRRDPALRVGASGGVGPGEHVCRTGSSEALSGGFGGARRSALASPPPPDAPCPRRTGAKPYSHPLNWRHRFSKLVRNSGRFLAVLRKPRALQIQSGMILPRCLSNGHIPAGKR
jgi:hypothetical protein